MEKRKRDMIVGGVLVAIIVISTIAAVTTFSNNRQEKENPPRPLNREIEFPRDEGAHDEPEEVWTIFMNITHKNSSLYFCVSWGVDRINDPENGTVLLSVLKKDNTSHYMSSIYKSDRFIYSNKSLNLNLLDRDRTFRMKYIDNFQYILNIDTILNNTPISLNLSLKLLKKPVLFAQQDGDSLSFGKLFFGNGTLFGYFLPRLSVIGNMKFGNLSGNTIGSAMFIHYWGGASIQIFEYNFMQIGNNDIFAITYYSAGGVKIELEQVYVVYNDTFSLYSTYEGNTIGAVIKNNTIIKELPGESYDYYPTSYVLDPTDPTHSRVYAYNWTLNTSYEGFHLEIKPIIKKQFAESGLWLGAAYVFDENGGHGWGFSALIKRYISDPYINKVDVKEVTINEHTFLHLNISVDDPIPIKKVSVEYTYQGENYTAIANKVKNKLWSVDIGAFDHTENTTIKYSVIAKDEAGNEDVYIGTYSF